MMMTLCSVVVWESQLSCHTIKIMAWILFFSLLWSYDKSVLLNYLPDGFPVSSPPTITTYFVKYLFMVLLFIIIDISYIFYFNVEISSIHKKYFKLKTECSANCASLLKFNCGWFILYFLSFWWSFRLLSKMCPAVFDCQRCHGAGARDYGEVATSPAPMFVLYKPIVLHTSISFLLSTSLLCRHIV